MFTAGLPQCKYLQCRLPINKELEEQIMADLPTYVQTLAEGKPFSQHNPSSALVKREKELPDKDIQS